MAWGWRREARQSTPEGGCEDGRGWKDEAGDDLGRARSGEMKGYLVTGREHTGLKDYQPAHYSNVC